ncbi:MAG: hypothetical protein HYV34_04025 [Candidatus Kerfeldbacteria bacterium]|nr:hypothetical protein [Candidatus Kerfeldbacteria bacterium]
MPLPTFKRIPVRKVVVAPVENKRTDQDLHHIYHDPEGAKSDMTRLERRKPKKGRVFALVVFILLLLAGVAWAGFFFFGAAKETRGSSVKLEFSAPRAAASGEEVEFDVVYTNTDTVPLQDLEMTMQYPDGFRFTRSEPKAVNEFGTVWSLPKVLAGGTARVKVTGQIFGEVNSSKTFDAQISYQPSNFSSTFSEKASHSMLIDRSIITLAMNAPTRIVSDQDFTYSVDLVNTSTAALEDIRLMTIVPQDFTFSSTEPARTNTERHYWDVERLAPSEKKTIKVHGKLSAGSGETREFRFQIGIVDASGNFTMQTESRAIIFVVKPELNLQLSFNASTNEQAVALGQELSYELAYENASDLQLFDVALELEFESEPALLDFDSFNDEHEAEVEKGKVTWTKEEVPEFAELKPNDSGTLEFSIKVKDAFSPAKDEDTNVKMSTLARVKSLVLKDVGEGEFEVKSESNTVTAKLITRSDVQAEARYYDDEMETVGSGPLPPEVGKTTTYRVYWYVSNTTNDVEDAVVQARLPENTLYGGRGSVTTGSALTFDPETRVVTWKVGRVPSLTGTVFSNAIASFDVSVTPLESDLGSRLLLIEETTLVAKDTFTDTTVNNKFGRVTSDLENDPGGAGKGEVVEPSSEGDEPAQ